MSVATPRATNRVIDALVRRRTELKNNNDRGFSLIELLVVVLIIGVLAAIAIPIYLNSVTSAENNALKAAATQAKSTFAAQLFENPDDLPTAVTDAIAEASNGAGSEIEITSSIPAASVTDANVDSLEFIATGFGRTFTSGSSGDPTAVTP